MRLQILLTVALVALSVTAHAADVTSQPEQYLCVVDQTAGFEYNSQLKTWAATNFIRDRKYIISESSISGVTFQVNEIGSQSPVGYCKQGFSELEIIGCDMVIGDLKFNRLNGRFLLTYPSGYYNVGSKYDPNLGSKYYPTEGVDTPYLSIGECSPF